MSSALYRCRLARSLARVIQPGGWRTLGELLTDPCESVRAWAAWSLGICEENEAVPSLIGALDDASLRVSVKAAEALVTVGRSHSEEVVAALITRLHQNIGGTRRLLFFRTAVALATPAGGLQHEFVLGLKDSDPRVRRLAVEGLQAVGEHPLPEVLDLYRKMLADDQDDLVRSEIILLLGRVGPPAATAVPQIIAAARVSILCLLAATVSLRRILTRKPSGRKVHEDGKYLNSDIR